MAFKDIFKVFDKNLPKDSDIEDIPSFMFCKWLTNHPYTVGASNEINKYHNQIPMINQYKMIHHTFKGKRIFIKFIKNTKDDDKITELIAKFYKVSIEKAKEYRELMSKNEVQYIVDMYKDIK